MAVLQAPGLHGDLFRHSAIPSSVRCHQLCGTTPGAYSALPHSTSFVPSLISKTIRSLSLCCAMGKGRLGCCVHLLQLWFCSHLSVISRAQPVGVLEEE